MFDFNEPNLKGPMVQPSNTITALSYILVALLLFKYDPLLSYGTLFLSITTIFFHAKYTLLSQWLDILSIIILILIFISRAYPFTNLNEENLFLGLGFVFIGFIFWVIDIKKLPLIPKKSYFNWPWNLAYFNSNRNLVCLHVFTYPLTTVRMNLHMVKVGINGFGRIGRLAFRIGLLHHQSEIEFAAINTSGSMETAGWAHLVNYDTTYRKFTKDVKSEELKKPEEITDENPQIGNLLVEGTKIPLLAQRDPEKIPWGKFGVDIVIESTGKFITEEDAKKHAIGGAKRVILSAPPKGGNVSTYVLSVNDYDGKAQVISNASCTTNCVAPVAAVIHAKFGIEKAAMTTIHGYTDDQVLQDSSHKDLRRARAAAMNIIPTTTGAAISTTETIPELKGLFDGKSLRVPIITGSITDFAIVTKNKVTVEEVNQAFSDASNNALYKNILAVTNEPLVSSDIIGRSESAIVDLSLTQVIGGNLVKIFAWYDNEWGYTNRLVEQVIRVGNTLTKDTAPSDPLTLTFNQNTK